MNVQFYVFTLKIPAIWWKALNNLRDRGLIIICGWKNTQYKLLTAYYPEHDGVAQDGGDQDQGEAAGPDDLVHGPR